MPRNTRAFAILTLLLTNFSGVADSSPGRPSESKGESQIRLLLTQQAAAWNRGDLQGFMEGYWKSPETTFAGANGVERGWQAVTDRYQRNYPNRAEMGTLDFSELEIHLLSKDAAFVMGRWHLDHPGNSHGPVGGVFTLVLQRFPQGLSLIHI